MATVTVTLLKRTDCAFYKLHIGTGATEAALALSSGHCFSVQPLISFPNAPHNSPDDFNAFVLEHALPLENSWFYLEHTSVERAVTKLVTYAVASRRRTVEQATIHSVYTPRWQLTRRTLPSTAARHSLNLYQNRGALARSLHGTMSSFAKGRTLIRLQAFVHICNGPLAMSRLPISLPT